MFKQSSIKWLSNVRHWTTFHQVVGVLVWLYFYAGIIIHNVGLRIFYNSTGALVLLKNKELNAPFVAILVVGAVLGGLLGASLSLRKGEAFIKKVFILSYAFIGIALLYQSISVLI